MKWKRNKETNKIIATENHDQLRTLSVQGSHISGSSPPAGVGRRVVGARLWGTEMGPLSPEAAGYREFCI